MTTPSSEGLLATSQGNVAYPKRPAADPELKLQSKSSVRLCFSQSWEKEEYEPNGIDVKITSTALTQAGFHCGLLCGVRSSTVEPVSIDGSCCAGENPGDTSRGISLIHDIDRCRNLRVAIAPIVNIFEEDEKGKFLRDISTSQGRVPADDMPVHLF